MANIKTAISIPESLFEQVDMLAQQAQISRSRLFVLAVEEFVRRHENQELLEAINRAYDDLPSPDEQAYRQRMRRKHREMVKGRW